MIIFLLSTVPTSRDYTSHVTSHLYHFYNIYVTKNISFTVRSCRRNPFSTHIQICPILHYLSPSKGKVRYGYRFERCYLLCSMQRKDLLISQPYIKWYYIHLRASNGHSPRFHCGEIKVKNCGPFHCRDMFTKFNENQAVEEPQAVSIKMVELRRFMRTLQLWWCQAK